MELQLKRNDENNLIIGKQAALDLIRENIGSLGLDGTPILVRYKETIEDDDFEVRTLLVIKGPFGSYTVFDGDGGGSKKVFSSDNSVKVTTVKEGYDLSILSPAIINYLKGLEKYEYKWGFVAYTQYFDLTEPGLESVTTDVKITSERSRELDGSKEPVAIESSTCLMDGWKQLSAEKWQYKVTPSDDDKKKVSMPITFKGTAINADGEKNDNLERKYNVEFIRWWFIVEHPKDDITSEELASYIADTAHEAVDHVGKTNNLPSGNVKWTMKTSNYYWILCPVGHKASVTQNGSSVVAEPIGVDSPHGRYLCYRSKSENAATEIDDVNITIS